MANGSTIGGGVFLYSKDGQRSVCRGAVRLRGIRVGAQLTLTGADLAVDHGEALTLESAEIRSSLLMDCDDEGRPFTAKGSILLDNARVGGRLDGRGARLQSTGPVALSARGIEVGGTFSLSGTEHGRFESDGTLRLNGARIHGALAFHGAKVDVPGGQAVNLDNAVIDGPLLLDVDDYHRPFEAEGQVRLRAAHIRGRLSCDRAQLRNAGGDALVASSAHVDQDVFVDCTRRAAPVMWKVG